MKRVAADSALDPCSGGRVPRRPECARARNDRLDGLPREIDRRNPGADFAAATDYLVTREFDNAEPIVGALGATLLRTAGAVLLHVGTAFVAPTDGQ
jgi:hypothetical protein